MLQNYLVTALRNIARHKLYSFINIAGLAVGLACVLFAILFVRDELSWDGWVPATENLYKLELTLNSPDRPSRTIPETPFPLAAAMRDESSKITGIARLYFEGMTLTSGDRQFRERVNAVDPGFFTLIQLPLIVGDRNAVLREPNSIVLSQSAAQKYFGDANPLGRILTTTRGDCASDDNICRSQAVSLKITGVMKDLPYNTQLRGDAFIPNTSQADRVAQETKEAWFQQGGWSYIRLAPGTDPAALLASMAHLLDRDVTPALHNAGILMDGSKAYGLHLTPFAKAHLQAPSLPPGSATTLYGVIAIGVLILLVACFNFMNLATARATLRAREIALRKTMGARRAQLVAQFLGEAVLMTLLALLLACAAVEVSLPTFGRFLQRPIELHYLADWPLVLSLLGVAVVAGLVSGAYPALVLSGLRPSSTLRGSGNNLAGSGRLRNLLVVLQFAISIGLGIVAMVVFNQIEYARSFNLGFRHDNILVVGGGNLTSQKREAFAEVLRATPGVIEVAQSNYLPFDPGQSVVTAQNAGQSEAITLTQVVADPNYPSVYDIRLVAGRALSQSRADDSMSFGHPEGRNVLVNVSGARRLGFTPQDAIGKTLLFYNGHVKIAGVLADARVSGAMRDVSPTIYVNNPDASSLAFSVRLRPDVLSQTLPLVDKIWHSFSPDAAIQRHFLEADFVRLYSGAEQQGQMFGIFVTIAIGIACLGLFGLAAFTASRRTREIGIRKVFGARVREVLFLLLWQFSLPVMLANAIAWPVAWYYLHGWLQGFAYRITLNPFYFLGAGLCALAIALATVFAHALHVARSNPIHALRYE